MGKKLSIAIPASVISDTPHLREKTSKVGLIGRAAAIFRVAEIIIYEDSPQIDQRSDMELIALLLNYMDAPQYLRKRMFKLQSSLEYAGILPPLRTPHHPLSGKTKHLKVGEYREGLVLSPTKDGWLVDIGVQRPALLRQKQFTAGERLTTQVVTTEKLVEVQVVSRDDFPIYWGYMVHAKRQSFVQLVKGGEFDLCIATARLGNSFKEVADKMGEKWSTSQRILVAFGAPSRGLHEIAASDRVELSQIVDFVINTVPNQGTLTVRTEEALLSSLAILNVHFNY
jgi:predicted SPOUT superfamily RNA methylase MTH1